MLLLKGCKKIVLKFGLEIHTRYEEIKVCTLSIGYFNGRS